MTTDTKAVARWSFDIGTRDVYQEVDGPYVLFTDHERVVRELRYWQGLANGYHTERDVALAALAASRAEVEGLKAKIEERSK